jgi:hypothetical protein
VTAAHAKALCLVFDDAPEVRTFILSFWLTANVQPHDWFADENTVPL